MRTVLDSGKIAQTMHAVFDGSRQLTRWRTCKVATIAALHRSGHHAKPSPLKRMVNGVEVEMRPRGEPKVRDRVYRGLTIRTKVFVTPAREKGGAK